LIHWPLRLPSGLSKSSAATLRKSIASLRVNSPQGWQHYFYVKRVGRNYGAVIACPHCDARPPSDKVKPWNRWRWLAMHEVAAHPRTESVNKAAL
jgi:hypothetical protein